MLEQNYDHWELLLINDGSNDQTEEVMRSYDDIRIRYFNQDHGGVSEARNLGFNNMTGDFFCFLDADDVLPINSLESRLSIFKQNPEVTFVDGVVHIMDEKMQNVTKVWKPSFIGDPFTDLIQLTGKSFFGPTWMVKREEGKNYLFKEGLNHGEDLLFYLSIATGGCYTATQDLIYKYRKGNESAMMDLNGLWKGYKLIYNELKQNYDMDLVSLRAFKNRITGIAFKTYLRHFEIKASLKVLQEYSSL